MDAEIGAVLLAELGVEATDEYSFLIGLTAEEYESAMIEESRKVVISLGSRGKLRMVYKVPHSHLGQVPPSLAPFPSSSSRR